MTKRRLARTILTSGMALAVSTVANSAPSTAQDPWSRVPAFPTGCYSGKDDFTEKLAASKEALARDTAKQKQINSELSDRVKQMDGEQQAARMQEFMMNNPQEAMKLMQRNQQVGATFADAGLKNQENWKKLHVELETLQSRYDAALSQALGPIDAKFKELDVRAQKSLVAVGETWDYAPWAVAEYNTLTAQANAAYEKVCREWWSSAGPFQAWLGRYRDHYVQDQIPSREEADNVGAGLMMRLVETPTASYKSTATLDAVREYMDEAGKVFNKRNREPRRTR